MRKLLKYSAMTIAALVVTAAVVYLAGGRIVLDGGGSPHLRFGDSADAHAAAVARHREQQRAEAARTPASAPPAPEVQQFTPAAIPAAVPAPAPAVARAAASPDDVAQPAVKTAVPEGSTYWTDFRGPRRDGRYDQQPLLVSWPSEGLRPVWKQPIGGGYASFVIARGRAFTIEQRGGEEVAAAYDVRTGRELWTQAWKTLFRESMGGDGPRATPTWSDGIVYVLGATGELRALDEATGRVVWRTNILRDASADNLQWGMAAAPLVVDDVVVMLPGGGSGRSVVAYDRRTGARRWSTLDDQQGYSSPMLVTLAGVRQIVVFSASRVMGLAPADGRVIWEHPWKTPYDVNASQPLVIGDNRLFVSTGYGTGAAVLEITPAQGRMNVREVWRNIRMKNQFTSSVYHDGFVYGLDEAILACVDAATGDLKWKGGRYGYGQTILAGDHLIVLTEAGDLVLVRASPERHQEVARFSAIEGKTWNHPAVSDGYLLVRNGDEMAAFDLRPRKLP